MKNKTKFDQTQNLINSIYMNIYYEYIFKKVGKICIIIVYGPMPVAVRNGNPLID